MQAYYKRVDEVVDAEPEPGARVLLHLESGEYYHFNATASALWEALTQWCSLAELAEFLVQRDGLSQADAERHVCAFIEKLRARDLVIVEERDR